MPLTWKVFVSIPCVFIVNYEHIFMLLDVTPFALHMGHILVSVYFFLHLNMANREARVPWRDITENVAAYPIREKQLTVKLW